MDQFSSSDLQFSKEKIEFPTSEKHEIAESPFETLIGIFEVLFSLAPLQKKGLKNTMEKYLRDKSTGFQCEPESHDRCIFHFPLAHLVLRDDKIEGNIFFGCVRDDDDDKEVTEKNLNLILMGKQFLLKFIEMGTIEADLNKASIQMADWAISNGGHKSSFILSIDSFKLKKRTSKVNEANGHQESEELFHFPMAHLLFRDGLFEGDIFFGCVRDVDVDDDDDDDEDLKIILMEKDDDEDEDLNLILMEKDDDDDDDDVDDDDDDDYFDHDHDYDYDYETKEDSNLVLMGKHENVEEEDLNLILMGKQFLLKFIELGRIEADLNKISIQIADLAIKKKGGYVSDAIMLIIDYFTFLKRSVRDKESKRHENTRVFALA